LFLEAYYLYIDSVYVYIIGLLQHSKSISKIQVSI